MKQVLLPCLFLTCMGFATPAEARNHCSAGKFYRVSLESCVSKRAYGGGRSHVSIRYVIRTRTRTKIVYRNRPEPAEPKATVSPITDTATEAKIDSPAPAQSEAVKPYRDNPSIGPYGAMPYTCCASYDVVIKKNSQGVYWPVPK